MEFQAKSPAGLRFAVPRTLVFDDVEPAVANAFDRAITVLEAAGARIESIPLTEFAEMPELNRKGGIAPPEALALHRDWIAQHGDAYDPRVRTRILRGQEQDAADYIQLLQARARMIENVSKQLAGIDALVLPTVPIVAPPIDALADDTTYGRTNALALRNPSIVNFIDGCAISVPCHRRGDAPVGFMIAALHGADRRLLSIAAGIERLISPS